MAGEWLKFDCSLPEKPEVLAITVAMGWDDPDLTVGKLMRLFRWFDQHTVAGNAASVTPALLDRIIGVTGFVNAVAGVGWIVVEGGSVSLHNFDRHNGATAKSRAQTAKRVANHKANAVGNGEGNAPSVSAALPREEKRREEEIQEPSVLVGSPPEGDESAPPATVVKLADRRIPCPAEPLLEAFHAECPTLPRVMKLNDRRREHMRARWREVDSDSKFTSAEDGVEVFRGVFRKVHSSDFLTGRAKGNGRCWTASFDWLFESSTNFLKVCEGQYDNDDSRTRGQSDWMKNAI